MEGNALLSRRAWAIPALVLLCLPFRGAVSSTPEDLHEELAPAIAETRQPFTPFQPPPRTVEDRMADPAFDACDWHIEGEPLQEASRDTLRGVTCHTFRWFDGLFGESEDFPEDEVNGLLTFGTRYTQYDGLEPRLRLRVRAPLPNANKRWDLLLGRVDEDDYIRDTQTQDRVFYNPGVINRDREPSWLLGLGHRRRAEDQDSGWDWSAGIRLRTPPVPYAKVAWYYNHPFTEGLDLRFRQTFFWRGDDQGWGTTSRGDLAWALDATNVLRWEGVATVSEETEQVEWYAGQTWYRLVGERSAFSLLAFVRGETDAEVELQEYGFNFIWRRPFTRDWLYLSLGPSITWPRYHLDEKRELSLGFGVWIEMEFGEWVWR